jgi:D-arabinono-1,4-lactone oxidase/FAD binding domain-containing protein
MKYRRRKTWTNHTGNQRVEPLRIYRPRTPEEIVRIILEAERIGCTVRAVGSGHSWSDVALTTGFLLETNDLGRILSLEEELLRPDAPTGRLVRTEAGIRLRELNAHLDRRGLALSNMGGYDAQTVAGVMMTSTHGSGIRFGPLSSFARSIDLIASGGRLLRIEPTNGITDPAKFAAHRPEWVLCQDDEWFNAVCVGMGCLGVLYAVTLEVEPAYWLDEVRTMSTWSAVRTDLEKGAVLQDNRHYEVYFNPYSVGGAEPKCLVTTRNLCPQPDGRPKNRRRRNFFTQFSAGIRLIPWLINAVVDFWPAITPRFLDQALKLLADRGYADKSYRVLNIGGPNHLPAYSSEIGIPVDSRRLHIQAVETIITIAEQYRRTGQVYHTSPVSLRFVRSSAAFMSMMHGHTTMMIELILMTDTEGGFELLGTYEEALYGLGGRPHWGQVNYLSGGDQFLTSVYPQYPRWAKVHAALNESRVFDSPFSKRVGIARSTFVP